MEFVAYPSTPDFFKFANPKYIKPTKGTSFIGTVKLHGTNASILCRSTPTLTFQYQSRNKVISTLPGDDNAGTAAFFSTLPMNILIDEILRIRQVKTYEEIFIAGEWAGTGIQSGVAVAQLERFFAIFNLQIDGHWLDIRDYKTVELPQHRVYNIANFETYEVEIDLNDAADCGRAYDLMKKYTLEVANSCPVGKDLLQVEGAKLILKKGALQVFGGEGIVWTMVPMPEYDTQLFNFKTKADQFLPVNAKASKRLPPANAAESEKVAAFVDYVLGDTRMEQGIEFLQEMGCDPMETKNLGEFMRWVIGDVTEEEIWRLDEREASGESWEQQGVTEAKVKKLVGERARQWFMDRRLRVLSGTAAATFVMLFLRCSFRQAMRQPRILKRSESVKIFRTRASILSSYGLKASIDFSLDHNFTYKGFHKITNSVMTEMETISAQQYPPKIQQLRHSIVRAEALVEDLTSRLIAAQEEYEGLQDEWLQYQASIAPVRKCPSEVLLMIFKLYLIDDPRLVGSLLLVCKHWYQVVSSSPQLWAHISVEFTDDWDVESISESTNCYVDACLQRSGSMMLELRLDFRQLLTIREQIIREILPALKRFVSSEGQQALSDWTDRLDTEALDNEWTMSSGHLDYAFELIEKLAGEGGSRMMRWRSLELQLPGHNNWLAKEVWDKFIYPAPNLVRMVVGTFDYFQYYFPQGSNAAPHAFPGLSALKHLEMQVVPDRRCFTASTSSLESIVMHGGVNEWTGTFLSSFTRLKTLELAKGHHHFFLPPTQCIISLPELHQLIVRGSFEYLWEIEFIVPKLRFLDIIQDRYSLNTPLPKVKPPHVRWEVEEDRPWDEKPQALQSKFRRILLEYRNAEHLTCPKFLKKHVIAILKELKANGTLSSAPKTVAFE